MEKGHSILDLHGDSPVRRRAASASAAAPENFWQSLPAEPELQSLRQESDPEILARSLLSFAARREREGHSEQAALLYQKISDFSEFPEKARQSALNRAQALQGNGHVGGQAEVLVSRFVGEATSPAPIVAMGVAGSVFKMSRALSLNILRKAPVDLLVARFSANTIGLLTESAAFTLAAKSVGGALGHTQDWGLPALRQEWIAGTLLLGSLKIGGGLAHQIRRSLAQSAAATESIALQRGLLSLADASGPLSLYGGILLGHQAQASLGLRPRQNGAAMLVDGAATLMHLYVGGGLANLLGAAKLNQAATALEWRIGSLAPGQSVFPEIFSPAPALAMAGKISERPEPMRMAALSPESSRFLEEAYAINGLFQRLPELTQDQLKRFYYIYPGMSDTATQHRFMALLARTSVSWEPEVLNAAIPTLSEAMKFADPLSNASSYSNWLTKLTFEVSFQRSDAAAMDRLLRFLGQGGRVLDLEAELGAVFPHARLTKYPPPLPHFWRGREELDRRISALERSPEAKRVLARWANALVHSPRSPFTSNFRLLDHLEYYQGFLGRAEHLDSIITLAGESALSFARLARLQLVLEQGLDPLTAFKLAELADPDSAIYGLSHSWKAPESPAASQSNAYLGERAPLGILAEMKGREADLLDPAKVELRQAHRTRVLEGLFPQGVSTEHLRPDVLATAFTRLGDPTSLAIARAILRRDFSMEILPQKAFRHRVNEFSSTKTIQVENAYFFPPQGIRSKGLMLFQQPDFSVYSKEASRGAFFGLMASLVHEYRHHLDIKPAEPRTKDVHFYQEMSAHFSEHLWKALHGDPKDYQIYTRDTGLGPAMRFHDYFEFIYGHWWRGVGPGQSTLLAGRQGP